METRASYVTVGAFVMICLLGLIISMLWITGAQYREEYIYFRTFFTGPVTGLGRGTIVRYNGIDVGNVTELAFDPADPRRVVTTLQTTPTLRLRSDSIASIESQGLTGASYVEIAGGSPDAPLLTAQPGQEYPEIPSKPSPLQQLQQTAPEMVARFNVVGERMSDFLNEDNRKSFSELLSNLRNTTKVIDQHEEDIDAMLANLRAVSANLNKTLANADKALGTADTALTAANHAIGTLDTAFNSADTTVKKVGQLSDDADKVLNGQSVAQLNQLMAQTRALVASLTRLSNDLEREPTKLIYGDQRQGYSPR
jgi:phospholipid/cholesterol/gamma-HCH transport system substrate-binding protein